jgi:predicted flap endonuclease-1-like 5' DNA nuclease/uncharacterized protein (DUF697 family)
MSNLQSDQATSCHPGDPSQPCGSIATLNVRLEAARRAQRLAAAKNLSRRYVLLATGLALLPLPLVDITAVLTLQVKLVHDLAHLYGVTFTSRMVKPLLTSLLSSGAVSGGGLMLIGLGQSIPGFRTLIGGGFSGSLAGSTLATSEIFIHHFEAGGTLVDVHTNTVQLPQVPPTPAPPSNPQAEEQPQSLPTPSASVEQQPSPQDKPSFTEPQPTELLITDLQSTEAQSTEISITDLQPTEAQATEPQPIELATTELQPTGPQATAHESIQSTSTRLKLNTQDPGDLENASLTFPGSETDEPSSPSLTTPYQSTIVDSGAKGVQLSDLERIYGIGVIYAKRLIAAGITDFSALAELKPEVVKRILGPRVSLASARDFIAQAKVMALENST